MKVALISALLVATIAASATAQENEFKYGLETNRSRRLDRRGSRKKMKDDLEKFKKEKATTADDASKSAKSSKSSKSDGLFLVPFDCPRMCVDGVYQPDSTELDEAVKDCNADEDSQEWNVHYDDEFMKFEGHASYEKGWCIGVESLNTCVTTNEPLSLVPCEDQRSDWYFNGGQLISGYCWISGVSSLMSAADCTGLLTLSDEVSDASTAFMMVGETYISSIPPPTQSPSESSAPSESIAPSESSAPSSGPSA